ncbi:MAG: CoB--CoM heterodisulfide reductase iron-sulfur subunit B family protein [Clostridia bacterium]|nr:CoB--CoM heterodisulfide reductase iron-sulfur subunit B family protein [Clostridia bacterium]
MPVRSDKIAAIPIPEKIFFFRSCVASNKYPGIEASAVDVLHQLGVDTYETDDQTCCGGFVTFANVAPPTASMPAVARNIALAEEQGLDIVAVCNGCWTFLTEFGHFLNHNPEPRASVNMMLHMMGHEYKGTSKVFHFAEMAYRLKDRIAEKVRRPLTGFRIATHYGCHYLSGGKYVAIDDANYPTFLEELIEIMGGEVASYPANRECCGTGFTQVINFKEYSLNHSRSKLNSLKDSGADMVVVICPYCHSQLDRMQQQLNYREGTDFHLPVVHLAQLVGLALGVPENRLAFKAHISGPERLKAIFERLNQRAAHPVGRPGVA